MRKALYIVPLLMLLEPSFAQLSDTLSPACKAAEAISGIWGLIQVVIVGVVVIGLLGGSAVSFMEKKGAWGIGLLFAGFILGAILWTSLSAIGDEISNFANNCSGGTTSYYEEPTVTGHTV